MLPPEAPQTSHDERPLSHEIALLAALACPGPGICIVDPDCGDGQLLAAMGLASQRDPIAEALLFGMATDDAALTATVAKLARHGLQYTQVEARPPGRFAPMRSKFGRPILADWLVTAKPPADGIDHFVADALAATQPNSGQMALVVPGAGLDSAADDALCAALAKRNLLDVLLVLPGHHATLPGSRLLLVRQDRHDTQIGVICNTPLFALNPGSANRPWPGMMAAYAAWQERARHPLLAVLDQRTLLGKLGNPLPLLGTGLKKDMYTRKVAPEFLQAMFGTDLHQGVPYWQIGQGWLEHFIGTLLPAPPPVPWAGQALANGGRFVAPLASDKLLVQSPNRFKALVLPESAGLVVSLFALSTTLEIVYPPDSIVTAAHVQLEQCYDALIAHAGAEYQAILGLID
jgi:hypothetical protein